MTAKEFFKKTRKFPFFEVIILAFILTADLVSKHIVAQNDTNTDVLGAFLRFTYAENKGASFSFLADKPWAPTFFLVISGVFIPALCVLLYFCRRLHWFGRLSLALIITGALGNFIDRVFLGYVRDFISVSFFSPIWNVADAALTVGVVCFAIYFIFIYKEPKKKKKEKIGETADGEVKDGSSSERDETSA